VTAKFLQAERLAHEADLEVVGVHPDLGSHVRDVSDGNDGVVGHGNPLSCAEGSAQRYTGGQDDAEQAQIALLNA
jgi:hypothetical protein